MIKRSVIVTPVAFERAGGDALMLVSSGNLLYKYRVNKFKVLNIPIDFSIHQWRRTKPAPPATACSRQFS
jgi:hypothetical protein